MGKQPEAEPDILSYDGAMKLIGEQITAMKAYRELSRNCMDENAKLVETLRFYADPATYRAETPALWEPIANDQGTRAREILKEAVGYD